MKKHSDMYRQGDLLIIKINNIRIPADASKKDNILAYGEATEHNHKLEGDSDVLVKGGTQYLIVRQKSKIVHEEHIELPLDPGTYEVRKQREYIPGTIMDVQD